MVRMKSVWSFVDAKNSQNLGSNGQNEICVDHIGANTQQYPDSSLVVRSSPVIARSIVRGLLVVILIDIYIYIYIFLYI